MKRMRQVTVGVAVLGLLAGGCGYMLWRGTSVSMQEISVAGERTFGFNTFVEVVVEDPAGAACRWETRRRPDPWGDFQVLSIRTSGGKSLRISNDGVSEGAGGPLWVDGVSMSCRPGASRLRVTADGRVRVEPAGAVGHPGIPLPTTPS